MQSLAKAYDALVGELRSYERVAVAFSGGVDSALLLHAAHEALGASVLAVIVASPFFPKREIDEALAFCADRGIEHALVHFDALADEAICANGDNRCYLCKQRLMGSVVELAHSRGIEVVVEGSNMDDEADYRPGMRAVQELGIVSPLKNQGLFKRDIRALSREFGLPTWDKQSFACLATRFAFGDALTDEGLKQVGQAEQFLLDLGFHTVRVRVHGTIARIELGESEIARALDDETRACIDTRLKELGFSHVTLDLAGYQSGSMNDASNGV